VLRQALKLKVRMSRASRWASVAAVVAGATMLVACGSDSNNNASKRAGAGDGKPKLIVAAMGFPCSLNDFAKSLCSGFKAGEEGLPPGYKFLLKTGTDFADQTGFNNLIQTSTQLNPGGMIVFPGGPSAQVPVLKQACAKDTKIIIIDIRVEGLGECQSGYVGVRHSQLGKEVGQWLVDHPPPGKEVGIVTFAPGQVGSIDERVKGFKEAIEPAGFKVVATVTTDLAIDKTRTQVTNMLTAHPKLGAIFSANDQMGYGTAQAVKHSGRSKVMQLTVDGALDAVKRIVAGDLAADAAQNPYFVGKQSVLNMAKLLQGQNVPPEVLANIAVVDETNAREYLAAGGLK
jgi:ribose transport system substrate-binding protein